MSLMFWFCFWFSTAGAFVPPTYAPDDDFFAQSTALQDAAWKLEDPRALREYTVLLTEYHSRQFLFRAFAMRNLNGNNALWLERLNTDETVMNETQGMVEKNLEELLVRAKKKFASDLNIRFAIAQFLYRGRDVLPSPLLKMKPKEILATFEEAYKKDIMSAASLYVLALKELPKDGQAKKVMNLLTKAHELNPYDPEIMVFLSNEAIAAKEWGIAAKTARTLFEIAPSPEFKTDALVNIARFFHYKKNYSEVMTAVNTCLDIQPRHAFAWNIGLDSLRAKQDEKAYLALVDRFVAKNLEDPSLFRAYLDYLKIRGTHPFDQTYINSYLTKDMSTTLAKMTQKTNLGNLHLQNSEYPQAKTYYEEARALFDQIPGAPPQVAKMIDELIQSAKEKAAK